jgi:tetratricopeptide (TPR) repeat protein
MSPAPIRALACCCVLGLALAPALHAASAAEAEFNAGEAAFRQGDTASAETHYRRVIESDPAHLRAILRLATVVSWSDRLDEAITLFERAIGLDPGNVDARLGLARTLSWKGASDRSIDLYRGLLKENPGGRDASLGLAQALGWAGRRGEAKEIYASWLAGHPGDVEARNGLAAVLSWDGRLDDALALYDETLQIDPKDKGAMSGRARVLYWQGRANQAQAAVDDALREHPGDRDAMKLDASMREGRAPIFDASAGAVHDSDHNAIDAQHFGGATSPSPAVTAGGSVDRFDAFGLDPSDPNGPRIHETLVSPRGTIAWRVAPDLVLSGGAGIDAVAGTASTSSLSGSAGADYRLDDRWSFSGALSRSLFAATALSLENGVGITSLSATAGFTPVAGVGTRLTVERDSFTDVNHRDLVAAYARWAVPLKRPHVGVSWSIRDLRCDERGTGYFCPHAYLASVPGLDLTDRVGRHFGWSLAGTRGRQTIGAYQRNSLGVRAVGRTTDTVWGYHVAATWDFDSGITAEAYAGKTNLASATGSGFASTEAGLRFRWRLGAYAPWSGRRNAR